MNKIYRWILFLIFTYQEYRILNNMSSYFLHKINFRFGIPSFFLFVIYNLGSNVYFGYSVRNLSILKTHDKILKKKLGNERGR